MNTTITQHSCWCKNIFGFGLLSICLLINVVTMSWADVVILKDGFAIHGKVATEQTTINDPLTGESIPVRKASGFTSVDDGPRAIVFSPNYKRVGDVSKFDKYQDLVRIPRPARFGKFGVGQFMILQKVTEFDSKWQRTLMYRDALIPNARYDIECQINMLTPYFARVVSTSHNWYAYYLTWELGPEVVLKLLYSHPDLADPKGKPDLDRRSKIIHFLMQTDWLYLADAEVERLQKDMPGETKKVEALRDELRVVRVERTLAEIELAKEGGRHKFAQRTLQTLPADKIPAKQSLKMASLRAEYEALDANYQKARRHLTQLRDRLRTEKDFEDLAQAAAFILEELHLDTISRLDLFNTLADQADNAEKAGRKPIHKPEELLSAAITGWLMGNNSTETRLVTARSRLKARKMALDYLRQDANQNRQTTLAEYLSSKDVLPFDELEKLISLLPPPLASKEIPSEPVFQKTERIPGTLDGVNYLLSLPPEYQHTRAYPLLLVLPNGNEPLQDVLKRMGDLPGRYGVVIAVVDWTNGGMTATTYDNKNDEPRTMLMGLLRHLRRNLQIDSDRVFLFGFGEGANMALDCGASFPGEFAGIIPMCPYPEPYIYSALELWKNFQNLPVYMVAGDKIGEPVKSIRNVLNSWTHAGYPALCAIYKGRGLEFFSGEFPFIFDWMSRKKRATGLPDIGKQTSEYRTVHPGLKQFFWVSSNDIEPRCTRTSAHVRVDYAPRLHAHLREGNRIVLSCAGYRQASIWLGRDSIDFTKPVQVTIEDRISGHWRAKLSPKIAILLEDLYERGDRQRPYYQRIDCENITKTIKFSSQ